MGEEALKKMAQRALGSSQKDSEEEKDPLEEAQKFTKQMAAQALIKSEVDKSAAAADKAKAEAEEAKAKAEKAKLGEAETKEPAIKFKADVDLGKFNFQEMLQQQQQELRELKDKADVQAQAQAGISDDLREKLHTKEMEVLKTSFEAQIQMLGKMIEASASRGSFMEQYNAAMETAKTLGFNQPQVAGDLTTQIELKKMEFEQVRELRRLSREEKSSDRQWQLDLRKLDDDRDFRRQEADRQRKRDEMFTNLPQSLGGAIAKGLVESEAEGGGVSTKGGRSTYNIEVPPNSGGEMDCPSCGEVVGIGPTARTAICAKCGSKIQIVRKTGAPVEEEEEE